MSADAQGLIDCLSSMSVADKRKADTILSTILLPGIGKAEVFWNLYEQVVKVCPKAYLITFVKAAVVLYTRGTITFENGAARPYSTWMTPVDKRKAMSLLLPLMQSPEDVEQTLHSFRVDQAEDRIASLTTIRTMPCRYALFLSLKTIEDQEEKIRNCCLALMKQHERFSFNLASIISQYFAIDNLPGSFSLKIKPYEQSRLEASYCNFCKLMESI